MSNANNTAINLFDLIGTDEEIAAEVAASEAAALVAAETALDAMIVKAAEFYTARALRLAAASKPSRRAHCERTVRYSRYD
jgi:hypothetical protein